MVEDKSEFNYAVSFLNRVNGWLCIAGEMAYDCNPVGWFHALLVVLREISDDMKDDVLKSFEDDRKKINQMITTDNKQNIKNIINQDLYDELHSFEIKLRCEIKKAGYKTKYSQDPRFAR